MGCPVVYVSDAVDFATDFLARKRDDARMAGGDPRLYIWYRGHSNQGWPLRPSLLRSPIRLAFGKRGLFAQSFLGPLGLDHYLNGEYARRGATFVRGGSLVASYIFSQHHGLPTRLLDWTESLLAALYFAVEEKPRADGRLFVLDVSWVERRHTTRVKSSGRGLRATITVRPTDEADEELEAEVRRLFVRVPGASPIGRVVAIQPRFTHPRLIQQGACFTYHPPEGEEIPTTHLRSARIPASAKAAIRQQLLICGVHRSTLFPDPDNLARDLQADTLLEPLAPRRRGKK